MRVSSGRRVEKYNPNEDSNLKIIFAPHDALHHNKPMSILGMLKDSL